MTDQQTPKRFKKACRRGQFARADYILRAAKRRFYDRAARLWLESGGTTGVAYLRGWLSLCDPCYDEFRHGLATEAAAQQEPASYITRDDLMDRAERAEHRLEQAEASLQQRTEALTKAQGLLREIYRAHRDTSSADYNECETAPCQFCVEVDEIDALLAPAPAVPGTKTKEDQEPLSRMDTMGSSTNSRTASENGR